jgi:3-methyladenine DNA glycosylase AlkC
LKQAAPALGDRRYEPIIFPDFVEVFGLDDWEASIPALEQFTKQSSSEFAVRPFIMMDQNRMMAQMTVWSASDNFHVRRLASEGCRPRLPWAMALPEFKRDPAPILPILEQLKNDETDYVRRSVANNLNDISKDHPGVVIEVLRGWQQGALAETRWITSHALRTLVKKGDSDALAILGFGDAPSITVENFLLKSERVPMGGAVTFSLELLSDAPQDLMIDYVMYFARPNGSPGKKVFKLTKRRLAAGEVLRIEKAHSFRPISTRTYYPGTHAIELQVNGQIVGRVEFELV